MMTPTTIKGLMLASGLATLAMMQPAMALDAQAFVDRIAETYKVGGYDITFGPASASGTTITVDGLTVSIAGAGEPMRIDTELTFTGVTETEDGGFTADTLTIPDIDTEFSDEPAGRVTLSDVVAEDIYLPPADQIDSLALMQTVGSVSTGPLLVTRNGADFFSIESSEAVNAFSYDDAGTLADIVSHVSVSGIWADLSSVAEEDAESGAVIGALGLTEINGDFNQSMSWSMADGHMVIDQMLFDVADVGAIDFTIDVSGFTPALLDKIYAAQATDLDPTSEEAQAQQMMLGMEMLQALTLTSSSLRYDDASFAKKLIDMFAAQSGAERAQFVEGLKAMVPALVGQAGIPALTDLVVPAANAFLDDPQSFEVAVRPATPTSLLVLSAAAANPAGLISALGLTVKANEAASQ